MWFCYILRCIDENHKNLTYGGSTNNMVRRLRQHNGIIKGGAKATRGKQWQLYALMSGFETRSNMLCAEWKINHPTGKRGKRPAKYCGVNGRIAGLNEVLVLNKWTNKCTIENKNCNYKLYVAFDVFNNLNMDIILDNIEIFTVTKLGNKFIHNLQNDLL